MFERWEERVKWWEVVLARLLTQTGIEPAAFGTGIRRWKERRKVMSDEMIRVERREKSDEMTRVFGGSTQRKTHRYHCAT